MQPRSLLSFLDLRLLRMTLLLLLTLLGVGGFMPGSQAQTFSTLHAFTRSGGEGADLYAGVLQGKDGALYGTTLLGGTNNKGTLFRLNTDGSGFVTLHTFNNSEGAGPTALIQGKDGALYGTTSDGGANSNGTVFKVNPDGSGFLTLHTFTGVSDGVNSPAAVLQGKDGALYGTTRYGSTNNYGTLFRLNTDGSGFVTLHAFTGSGGEGAHPNAGVLQGKDGALYGTTSNGGANNNGTVFRLTLPTPPRFDVNGDGHLDLLWYNQTTTGLVAWLQNGLTTLGSASLATGVDTHWKLTGVADLNSDGNTDFLWRNTKTGDVTAWFFTDPTHYTGANIAAGVPLNWQLVGPR